MYTVSRRPIPASVFTDIPAAMKRITDGTIEEVDPCPAELTTTMAAFDDEYRSSDADDSELDNDEWWKTVSAADVAATKDKGKAKVEATRKSKKVKKSSGKGKGKGRAAHTPSSSEVEGTHLSSSDMALPSTVIDTPLQSPPHASTCAGPSRRRSVRIAEEQARKSQLKRARQEPSSGVEDDGPPLAKRLKRIYSSYSQFCSDSWFIQVSSHVFQQAPSSSQTMTT